MKTLVLFYIITACIGLNGGSFQPVYSYQRFNHVFLSVNNVDSSLGFYTKAFGLEISDRFNELNVRQTDTVFKRHVNVIFLKFPGQDFVFELAERLDKKDTVRASNLFQHVGVEVKDIELAVQKAIDAGGKIMMPVRNVRTNSGLEIEQAYIKGPDGETIELTQIISGKY